ncbi:MAG: DUF2783 domain-containing protein [Alphaproteobacteria bacterium]
MTRLITGPNLPDPDSVYARLIAWHDGRAEAESHRLNAKLVLILANHIGDPEVIEQALALADASSFD